MFALSFLLPVVLGWGIYEIFSGSGSSDEDGAGSSGETTSTNTLSSEVNGSDFDDTIIGTDQDDALNGRRQRLP